MKHFAKIQTTGRGHILDFAVTEADTLEKAREHFIDEVLGHTDEEVIIADNSDVLSGDATIEDVNAFLATDEGNAYVDGLVFPSTPDLQTEVRALDEDEEQRLTEYVAERKTGMALPDLTRWFTDYWNGRDR